MPVIPTKNLNIYFETQGEGNPVLFINGTGGDLRMKPGVMEGPLPQAMKTVAYDQRGLGQSEKPDGPYSMAQYGDDAANLLDALEIEQVDVVGVSFGGMVAQHFALRHPNRIRRLVLCCTSPGGDIPSFPFHELPDDISMEDRLVRLMGVSDLRLDSVWQAANRDAIETMLKTTHDNMITDHQTSDFKRGAKEQLLARAGHDVTASLSKIEHQVLICAGKYDGIAPEENQHALHEALPNSRLEWFEGGHLFLAQDRSAWKNIIDFLRPATA